MGVLVRAKTPGGKTLGSDERKAVGYYDLKRRYDGDEFELSSEKHFSDTWMELVGLSPEPALEPIDAKVAKQILGKAHVQALKSVTGGD